MQHFKRRSFLAIAVTGITSFVLPPLAAGQQVPLDKLMQPGPLPDKVIGKPEAPVTVIEYASMTCGHCRRFHTTTWPTLKTKYVDTGKVRFILREFPFDPLAASAAMLARCAGDDKWYPMVDLLFQTQESWAHSNKPADAMAQIVRQNGMSRAQFDACLRDDKLLEGITAARDRAAKEFSVNSTPTFFINGRKETGALTIDQFERILEPLLATHSK